MRRSRSGGLTNRVVEDAADYLACAKIDGGSVHRKGTKNYMSDTDGKKTLGLRGGPRPGK